MNPLNLNWQYYISRNLPVWHDELYYLYGEEGYKKYKLPFFFNYRVHRGIHSDFYHLGTEKYLKKLMANLAGPAYLKFLQKQYRADCSKLIQSAKAASKNAKALKDFFELYGRSECMLDITSYSSKAVTQKLLSLLSGFPNKEEIIAYYSRPAKLAPMQRMEQDLKRFHLRKMNYKIAAEKLWSKYAWIPLGFVGEPWTLAYFENLVKNYRPEKKRATVRPKGKISKQTLYYLKVLATITYLNEYRKAAFSQACYLVRPVLNRLAKEHGLKNWQDTSLLTHNEILDLRAGRDKYQKDLVKRRSILCALYSIQPGKINFAYGYEVNAFEKKFKPRGEGLKEIKGVTASPGVAAGPARIIRGPADFGKFKTGDILIAKMTSVDFLPIMKKAAAFVTDEGGLACHAAVISREYGVPCLVGTDLATSVFRSGDLVEVNATKGIVKKI